MVYRGRSFENLSFRKLSTSLDLPKLEFGQGRNLGHIWVFFITQIRRDRVEKKGVFQTQPP
jgi:hypothetical protein